MNSSMASTKPLKNTEASSTSSDSWTACRSESDDDREKQPEPERREAAAAPIEERDRRRGPRNGTPRTATIRASVIGRDAAAEQAEGEDLAHEHLQVLTGETRNSSMTPLVRSRTSDRAMSVTARCWRISARTAGAK